MSIWDVPPVTRDEVAMVADLLRGHAKSCKCREGAHLMRRAAELLARVEPHVPQWDDATRKWTSGNASRGDDGEAVLRPGDNLTPGMNQ